MVLFHILKDVIETNGNLLWVKCEICSHNAFHQKLPAII